MQDWKEYKVGQLGDFYGGGTPSSTDPSCWDGDIPWLVPSDISNSTTNYIEKTSRYITAKGLKNSSAKLLPEGTISMSSRATIGDCVILKTPMATNQGFINIVCNDIVCSEFLLYWIKQHKNYILKYSAGTTFDEIGKSTFKRLSIVLPSFDTQKRIAKLITVVDEVITITRQGIEHADRLKKSLMQNLLTGKLKPDGTWRKPDEFYDDHKFGKVPIGWVIKKGNKLTDKITKGQSPKWQGFQYQSEGTLFVTSENILVGRIDIGSPKYLPNEFNNKIKGSQLQYGDVLINIVGASIGRCAVFELENIQANINQAVCLFRPNNENDSKFLSLYFQLGHTQFRLIGNQVETARANLSLGDFRKFKFVIPESKDEQIEIANSIEKIDAILKAKHTKIQKLERLKKSLMQNLLTGKVRVKVKKEEFISD